MSLQQVANFIKLNQFDKAYQLARREGYSTSQISQASGKPSSSINAWISSKGYQPLVGRGVTGLSAPKQQIAEAVAEGDFNKAYQIAGQNKLGAQDVADAAGKPVGAVRDWVSSQGYKRLDDLRAAAPVVRNEYLTGTPQPVRDPSTVTSGHRTIEPAGSSLPTNTMWRAQPGTTRHAEGGLLTPLGESMGDTAKQLIGGNLVAPYDPLTGAANVDAPAPTYGSWRTPGAGETPGQPIPFGRYYSANTAPAMRGGAAFHPPGYLGPPSTAWRPTGPGGANTQTFDQQQPGTRTSTLPAPTGGTGGVNLPPPTGGGIPTPETGGWTGQGGFNMPRMGGMPNVYGGMAQGFSASPWGGMGGLPFMQTPLYGGSPYGHMMNPWMSGFQSPMNQWFGGGMGMNPYGGMGGMGMNPYGGMGGMGGMGSLYGRMGGYGMGGGSYTQNKQPVLGGMEQPIRFDNTQPQLAYLPGVMEQPTRIDNTQPQQVGLPGGMGFYDSQPWFKP